MAEVTKEDLNRVYDKIDALNESVKTVVVSVTKVQTTLKNLPAPQKRPCVWHEQLRKEFDGHVDEHDEVARDWRQAAIKAVVDIVKLGVVAGLGVILGLWLS